MKKSKTKSRKIKKIPIFCKMYFGAPGSGKTTIGVQEAQKALRKGYPVFTNFPCPGCYKFEGQNLGKYQIYDALVVVDEAGIDYNNRQYKQFSQDMVAYIKYHRHYRTRFIFLSQGWDDCDKKIRTVCTEYWYVRHLGPLSWRRLMLKRVGVNDVDKQIIDEYYKQTPLFGGLKFCWRPRWYKYFDSWQRPALPDYPRVLWSTLPSHHIFRNRKHHKERELS